MSELREVFEMVTKQTEPDLDAWNEQERRQRRASRNRKFGALAIAAAIGVVAVVVVIRAADEGTGTQPGGLPTPTAAQPIPSLPGGALEPGRYVFTSYDPGLDASYRISIDVADGYEGIGGWAARRIGTSQTGVNTLAIGDVYADPCQWEGSLIDRSAISSTDDVVAALASQEGLRVSTPTDVTVDGFAGTYMERTVPARTDLSDCDGGRFRVYLEPSGGDRYLVPGLLQRLWILDIEGVPLVIEAGNDQGTSAQVRAELVQMVESVQIDPR
jgi:hypothetical protein